MDNEMMKRQLEGDARFYQSLCLANMLLEEGLITKDEYREINSLNKKAFSSGLI